jgi:Integrase core domain
MVLGYSRALFLHFATTQRLETFRRCHLVAFAAFGGYPRELLYDHAKTVVLARPDWGTDAGRVAPHWHSQFLDFAGYYGFTPRLCRPYRACTKGKVERMIRYVRESFFVGCHFVDLDDLNRQAAVWCTTVANARVHATTRESPAVRLAREPLLPLTGRPPGELTRVVPRRVSAACMVAYAGNHYSVPYLYGGRQVLLRVREEHALLEIWAEETCVAIHPLLAGHGRQSLQPEHLTGLWRLTLKGKGQRPLPPPSPPPPREEATGPLHLPGLAAMPEVEVRPLTVYAAWAEEAPA